MTPGSGPGAYHRKLARVLDRMGGLYTVDDLLTAIGENRMQSFAVDNSWLITQVVDYPRARVLQVVALAGDLKDRDALERELIGYANDVNAGLISAHGRAGWLPHAYELGWRVKARSYLFHKDC